MKYGSKGLVLKVAIAGVLTAITQVTNITFPDGTVATWQSTCLETPGASHTHQVTGWVDEGDITFNGFYDPSEATHGYLQTLRQVTGDGGSPERFDRDYEIELPFSLGSWLFAAILTKFTPKGGVEEPLAFDAAAKVTGTITYP